MVIDMVDNKNIKLLIVLGGLILLAIGLVIGFNINEKNVYSSIQDTELKSNSNTNDKTKQDLDENTNIKKSEQDIVKEDINNTTNENNDYVVDNNNNNNNNNKQNDNIGVENKFSNEDQNVINSLNNTLTEVNKDVVNDDFKTKAKGTFIAIVDFLFYDGEINGVKFSELTEAGKQEVLKLANKIDVSIENKIPGYKESISNTTSKAFNRASEIISDGSKDLNLFAQEKLGEDNYNSIIAAKDELVYYTKKAISFIGNVGSNLFNSAKDKLNNWYQNFKNK